MPKYRVTVMQTKKTAVEIEVDGENRAKAMQKALWQVEGRMFDGKPYSAEYASLHAHDQLTLRGVFMNKQIIKTLDRCLKKGKMSPMLRDAIASTKQAVEAGDIGLAYQLSAVKSFISGSDMRPETYIRHAFQEDHEANEKVLKGSLYHIMDGIHFRLALQAGKLPSGMMLVSMGAGGGKVTTMKPKGVHPVIKQIKKEHRAIVREANRIHGGHK